jgi:8-amino-7-oxononanoate synthase
MKFPKKLQDKLQKRIENHSLRSLPQGNKYVDFSSNDYLGLSQDVNVFQRTHEYLVEFDLQQNGATGSRLISGNHELYTQVEDFLSEFHQAKAALIFNSGYDANLGFFSSVPQRGDVILYDELSHASIRDGITMSNAKSYKFKHNDVKDLKGHLQRVTSKAVDKSFEGEVYVVTESVFSMDGDSPDLKAMSHLVKEHNAHLVVDEAHSVGVFGRQGVGLLQELDVEVFARIITFGKALGCHGAAILGSKSLQQYLVNFARSFIYTTGLPPHSLATILLSYQEMMHSQKQLALQDNIAFFKQELARLELDTHFIESNSAIHCCVISGNQKVKSIAKDLQNQGFDVKAILSPTVPEGQERIRFCLHAYNSYQEMTDVLTMLRIFATKLL